MLSSTSLEISDGTGGSGTGHEEATSKAGLPNRGSLYQYHQIRNSGMSCLMVYEIVKTMHSRP